MAEDDRLDDGPQHGVSDDADVAASRTGRHLRRERRSVCPAGWRWPAPCQAVSRSGGHHIKPVTPSIYHPDDSMVIVMMMVAR